MKRKLFLLICGIVAVSAFFAGCTARVNKDNDLSADDIVGLVGAKFDDFKKTIGNVEQDIADAGSARYSYKRSILGIDSNIAVTMDSKGDKVERVVVYTDKEHIDKWRSVLGKRYGEGISDSWKDDHTRVKITDDGKTAIISIENIA